MKINTIHASRLSNDEHFQFIQSTLALVSEVGAEALKAGKLAAILAVFHKHEDEALKKIMKSAFTEKITAADKERDTVFRAMYDTVRAARSHFNASTRDAAERLFVVLESYGNLASKSHAGETSAIYNLVDELKNRHSEDCNKTAIGGWLDELSRLNKAVDDLIAERADELASRTPLVVSEVRAKVDEAYRAMTDMIDAQALVASTAASGQELVLFPDFIRRLNERIDEANNAAAIRAGRAEAAAKKAAPHAAAQSI